MISIDRTHRFLTAEAMTLFVEGLVLIFLLYFVFHRRDIPLSRLLAVSFFATFGTIPYVWFFFPYTVNWTREESYWYSEPFVTLMEALFYRLFIPLNMPVALAVSITCNIASFAFAYLITANGLWFHW